MERCISCNKKSPESIRFPCAKCKKEIVRCAKCRTLSIEYKCSCGQKGP